MLTLGSLFTGYGGLDLAVEQAFNARTAWTSDVDPGACKIIAHRYPDAPNLGDITAIDWANVEPVDIIAGGSPCQDVSTAGRRAGMTNGTRSNLWTAMREGIAHVRPRFVVWENVRGVTSATAASAMESDPRLLGDHPTGQPVLRALGRVLGDLADLGYDAQWCGLPASGVGAPHQRYRVFLLAHAAGVGREARRPEPEGQQGRLGAAGDPQPTADAGRLRGPAGRLATPGQAAGGRSLGEPAGRDGASTADASGAGLEGYGGLHAPARKEQAPAHHPRPTAHAPGGGGEQGQHDHGRGTSRSDRAGVPDQSFGGHLRPRPHFGKFEAAIQRWEQVTGRLAPSPTDERNRLTARFPEWMMGLPPGWITDVPGITRNEALKACGNGVVPQQAIAALTHMINTK